MERVEKFFSCLKEITATPKGITRIAFSDEDWKGRAFVQQWMKELGLEVREDAFGNYFGRLSGEDNSLPPIMIGSHMDSVPEGGNYDGPVGVFAGLEIVKRLMESKTVLKRPLEVAIFLCEESARFRVATLGSRAFIGELSPEEAEKYVDKAGQSLAEVLRSRGFDPNLLGKPLYEKAPEAFFEVHIEQGKVLEVEGKEVGIVQGIAAPSRYQLVVTGKADHSGATPMNLRQDALCGAAEIILSLEKLTKETLQDVPVVGTIGVIEAKPGALNVIPGAVELGVDIRSISADKKAQIAESFLEAATEVCEHRGLSLAIRELGKEEPVMIPKEVQARFEKAVQTLGVNAMSLPSGAGHDAMYLAKVAPTGMLFIPCKEGISHNSLESTEHESIVRAVDVLEYVVRHYDDK